AKNIDFRAACGCSDWAVLGDLGLMSNALMNLCLNSADAITERGTIVIETKLIELAEAAALAFGVPPGSYLELAVRDDGYGMAPEVLARAFEPFFSTKDSKRRSGLGLPMVYGAVQQHRGGLKIESEPGRGTRVQIVLPAYQRLSAPAPEKAKKTPVVSSSRPLALFVDDEPLLRKAGKRMLSGLGYEVVLASNGHDAVQKFNEHRHRIGVVILDVAMPVMGGAECCEQLRKVDPDLPVVFASGFPKGHDVQSLTSFPKTRYVHKPYELDDISNALAELAEAFRPSVRLACQANLVRIQDARA
ncbi:MAG TPA: response regulator, partial [Polyangiaceae bacterium]|nr:response regulator [Polyangiaceae bacterium]